jgi:hypothetical protein
MWYFYLSVVIGTCFYLSFSCVSLACWLRIWLMRISTLYFMSVYGYTFNFLMNNCFGDFSFSSLFSGFLSDSGYVMRCFYGNSIYFLAVKLPEGNFI